MRSRQSGFANFKAIFVLVLLGVGGYLTYKLLPPFMNNYLFQEEVTALARNATYAMGKSAEDIRTELIRKGKEYDIPLTPQDVQVVKEASAVSIDIKYTIRVELPGKIVDLSFNPAAGNKMLTAK